MNHVPDLAVLNYTQGLAPLFRKLPQFLKNKWQAVVYRYSSKSGGRHPPFDEFCKFLDEQVQTFSNTDAGRGLTICDDADDMFSKLGI